MTNSPAVGASGLRFCLGLYVVQLVLMTLLMLATKDVCVWFIKSALNTHVNQLFQKPFLALLPITLGLTLAFILVYAAGVHLIERRRFDELPLAGAAPQFLIGLAAGMIIFAIVFATLVLSGDAVYQFYAGLGALPAGLLLFTAGVVPEELIFRGTIFRITERWLGTACALGLSASLFAAVHLDNRGVMPAALLATFVAGLDFALAYALTRSLWAPIGLHLGWNLMQGTIFGTSVSGHEPVGLLRFRIDGPTWVTGGVYGPENTVAAIMVWALVGAGLVCFVVKQGNWVRTRFKMRADWSRPGASLVVLGQSRPKEY